MIKDDRKRTLPPTGLALSRRNMLLGAAAAMPVAAMAAGQAAKTMPDARRGRHKFDYDVVVVGAGFAGVTAARELGAEGYRVLVLEGRSRLGGRTYRGQFAGEQVEFGGAWVHWVQPHIWAEVQRYGHGVEEELVAHLDKASVLMADGRLQDVPLAKLEELDREGMDAFCAGARELFPRPHDPFFNPKVRELEKISARAHIDKLPLSELHKAILNAEMTLYGAGASEEFSYVSFVKLFACASWDYYTFNDADRRYRIGKGGTLGLLQSMLEHSRAEVRLATPVTAIHQAKDHVRVTTDAGQSVTARSVVVTVPTNTYKRIKFTPELSAPKRAYIDQGEMSEGAKVFVQLKKNHGNVFAFSDAPNPLTVLQTIVNNDKVGSLLSLTLGRRSLLDINDADAVEKEVRKIIPGAEMTGISNYDWARDPFSMSAWPSYRVGQFSLSQHLAEPEGRVMIAGGASAAGWHEYIDGAVESGLRAGRQVRELFARETR